MFGAIGLVVILVCVFGSFIMSGGKIDVVLHALPHEMMAIGGAAVGSFLVANSLATVKLAGKGLVRSFKGPHWKTSDYRDLLALIFLLLTTLRQRGAMALEPHLDDPGASPIFTRFPRIMADHHLVEYACDYGLLSHRDDAEQCCAIAAFRALETYDPEKSQFTTHVNWQIRGELQGLRFRVMTDQRPSARKVEATTVSIHGQARADDGGMASLEALLLDEQAEQLTRSAAEDYVANRAMARLLDAYSRRVRSLALDEVRRQIPKRELARLRRENPMAPAHLAGLSEGQVEQIDREVERDRALVLARLFGEPEEAQAIAPEVNSDRLRRLGRRATKIMLEIIDQQPGFALMREHLAEQGSGADDCISEWTPPVEPQRRYG